MASDFGDKRGGRDRNYGWLLGWSERKWAISQSCTKMCSRQQAPIFRRGDKEVLVEKSTAVSTKATKFVSTTCTCLRLLFCDYIRSTGRAPMATTFWLV